MKKERSIKIAKLLLSQKVAHDIIIKSTGLKEEDLLKLQDK